MLSISSVMPTMKRIKMPTMVYCRPGSLYILRRVSDAMRIPEKMAIPPRVGTLTLWELRSLGLSINFFCLATLTIVGMVKALTKNETTMVTSMRRGSAINIVSIVVKPSCCINYLS